jgi:hypothetical protein
VKAGGFHLTFCNIITQNRSKAQALVFYAFDVLIYRGRSVLTVREVLNKIFEDIKAASIGLSENIDATWSSPVCRNQTYNL